MSASTALARSQPSSKRRSAQASSPARGVRRDDERAERAQRRPPPPAASRQSSRRAAEAGGERHRPPGAAVGARPRGRAERGLGVVPQAQRGLQPAQAPAGVLERPVVARRALEREHARRSPSRHGRCRRARRSSVPARTSARPSPSGELLGLDHEAVDGCEHDRQRAAVVGGRLELGEGVREARRVEAELGRLGPDRGQERLQRGVGLRAAVRPGRAPPARPQVGRQVGQRGHPLGGGGVGGKAHERADALADEAAGERAVAVERGGGPRVRLCSISSNGTSAPPETSSASCQAASSTKAASVSCSARLCMSREFAARRRSSRTRARRSCSPHAGRNARLRRASGGAARRRRRPRPHGCRRRRATRCRRRASTR